MPRRYPGISGVRCNMEDQHRGLARAGYVTSVLMPVVGFVIGAVLLTKDRVGKGVAVLVMSVLAATLWTVIFAALLNGGGDRSVVAPSFQCGKTLDC